MANIQINQLPTAGAITGQELVPIQQNGVTVQTTTAAISASPSQTQTFLTVGLQTTLPNSRYFSTGAGLGITDGGAQGAYTIAFNGTAASLEASGTGFVVKTAANTITPRSFATSGNGISVTDGDGIAGNPTFQLTGLAQAIANMSGTGLIGLNSSTLTPLTIIGTSNQIGVLDGNGAAGNPTISLADNFIAPGTAGITLPNGTTAQRGATTGQIRYNTDTARFEGYYAGSWQPFGIGDGTITSVSGTTNQIDVNNVGSIATVAMSANPIVPGNGGVVIPVGTTAQRNPSPTNGTLRYNTSTATFEGYANGVWGAIISGSGVTSIATGTGLTGGPITSTGTISIANTGAAAGTYGNAARTVTQAVNAQGQITSIYDQPIDGIALTTGSISTSPTTANDIANKSYVDGLVSTGLVYHQPVQAATAATLASITGGTVTYNNGAAGVGATLTLSVALTILDGYTLLNTNRILVKDEANQAHNGIYTWATGGTVLTRATDADTYGTGQNQLSQNDYFFTQNGTVNKGTSYVVTTIGTIVFGTTAIIFAEFSSSQVYTAGTGLTLSSNQFSITAPVTAALGGTGQSAYTSGDLIYASGTTALSKLAAGTNGYLLTMNAGLPTWQPAPASGVTSFQTSLSGLTPSTSTTGAVTLAGTLGVANGGTGLTSVATSRIPYGNGASALNTSANLTFDGTTLTNTGNAIISDNSANAALRITQVGAGNAILVEDSTNPDATPFVVDQVGRVLIGTSTNVPSAAGVSPNLQISGTDYPYSTAGINRFTADNENGYLFFGKSRGATVGSFSSVTSGDNLGTIRFSGADGTQLIPAATILSQVDGTPGTNDMPGRLVFATTADGAASPTERMRIDNAGRVTIGSGGAGGINASIYNLRPISGGVFASAHYSNGQIQSTVTSGASYFETASSTAAAAFTLSNLRHYYASNAGFGAGSAVTNQYGFSVDAGLTGATNNYGFYGNIASGTGRWNFYAEGTAANYLAGGVIINNNLGVGAAGSPSYGTSGQVLTSAGAGVAPTWVTPAGGVTLANDTSTATNLYPTFAAATSGSVSTIYTGNANLLYKPSTGELQSTVLNATNGIVVNSATVAASYTIPTGSNAVSAGPVTIASGVVVTVSSGSVWAIV